MNSILVSYPYSLPRKLIFMGAIALLKILVSLPTASYISTFVSKQNLWFGRFEPFHSLELSKTLHSSIRSLRSLNLLRSLLKFYNF